MASANNIQDQHDITAVPAKTVVPPTPEDEGDEQIEGGEIAGDIDKMDTNSLGNEPRGTISEEIDADEEAIEKGPLDEELEEEPSSKSS